MMFFKKTQNPADIWNDSALLIIPISIGDNIPEHRDMKPVFNVHCDCIQYLFFFSSRVIMAFVFDFDTYCGLLELSTVQVKSSV